MPRCRLWVGGLVKMGRAAGYNIRWITMCMQQAAYHPELHDHIQYMHYTELDDAETFDVIFTFQCTDHIRSDELHRFGQKMESLLTPNGILLVEFMKTVTEFNCNPFVNKFIFPDGARFPLSTAIAVFEQSRRLRLQSIDCLDEDDTRTITEWNKRLTDNQVRCVELLDGNQENIGHLRCIGSGWSLHTERGEVAATHACCEKLPSKLSFVVILQTPMLSFCNKFAREHKKIACHALF